MSQHYFDTAIGERKVRVVLGWDRPLGHFFMTIEQLAAATVRTEASPAAEDDEEAEDDGYLYSNLNELNPFGKSLDFFKAKLTELGITAPVSMFEQVRRDEALNVGNRYVWHNADGTFRES